MKENVEKRTNRETKVEKKEIAKEKKEIAKEKKEKEKRRPPLLLPVAKRSPTTEIQKELRQIGENQCLCTFRKIAKR